jgi:DNA-binding CsgD family transcriptional regulator
LAAADAGPAAADALMRIEGGSFVFRHPLVRSAAYGGAAGEDRRRAHRMLAELAADEVERAWHLSAATAGRDDHVAAAMEEAGAIASARAAFGPALQAYARSASLSTAGRDEARRLRLAAEAAVDAGLLARAAELAAAAEHLAGDPLEKARIWAVRANVENACGTPDAAHELFSRAAASAGAADARYSSVLIVSAVGAALLGGWPERAFAPARGLSKGLPTAASPEERFVRAFLEGVCALFSGAPDEARQQLEEAVGLREEFTDAHLLTRVGLACVYLGDVPRARECYQRAASSARASGSFAALPLALLGAGQLDIGLRSLAAAENNAREGLELTRQLGHANFETCFTALLARVEAYRGHVEECRQLAAESLRRALAANVGIAAVNARLAVAELELGLGAGAAAREQLEQLPQEVSRLTCTPDLVEAAVLEGAPDTARQAVTAYAAWTRQAADPYLTALTARCEAQLAGGGQDAGPLHRKTMELMTASHAPPFERARTELLYGEYLRRGGHKALARAQLRNALATFEGLGTPLWSARARAELEATGITTRQRDPSTLDTLTPQEARIARLVAAGATNRDVAAQLFLSPKTVEYHLAKVFHKLGVSSRVELARQPLDHAQLPAGPSG